MRPWFSLLRTIVLTVVCVFGIVFMSFLGFAYTVKAATVVGHMNDEDVAAAARSCYICAAAYAVCTVFAGWQLFLHWRNQGGVTVIKEVDYYGLAYFTLFVL